MNNVLAEGKGIVDALTLAGKSEIRWERTEPYSFGGSAEMAGDLELIVGGKAIRARHVFLLEDTYLVEGRQRYSLTINRQEDYHVISIGGLRRYFIEQLPIDSYNGLESWDEIFEAVKRNRKLILRSGGYFGIVKDGKETFNVGYGEQLFRQYIGKLTFYWDSPMQELLLLETIGERPENVIQWSRLKRMNDIEPEFEGEISLHPKSNGRILADGRVYDGFSGIRGNGKGTIRAENITIPPPVMIKSEYARVGIGELDYSRKELDERVMHIKSTTSEELKDCMININVTDDCHFQAGGKLHQKNNYYTKLGILCGMLTGLSAASFATIISDYLVYLFLASVPTVGLVGGVIGGTIAVNANKGKREYADYSNTQLDLSFSGTQTSRWLERYPEYLELGRRLTAPQS